MPTLLEGRDAIIGAQTGTGKTASFALPILQLLQDAKHSKKKRIRALILAPTRELAAQIGKSIENYGRNTKLSIAIVHGGVNIRPQIKSLKKGVDILVATPGRLLDHLRSRTVNIARIEIFVLDEADRMLDLGFLPDIQKITKQLPPGRQSLMFSATYKNDVRKLAYTLTENPVEILLSSNKKTADLIKQVFYPVNKKRKRELLSHLIGSGTWKQVLVFTRTKRGADKLSRQLDQDGIKTAAIHGNKSQKIRTTALTNFKKGKIPVLIATDIAARGLDIAELPYVINFDLPNIPEDYVHRIGRTGRAGHNGIAISLVSSDEEKYLSKIQRLTKAKIKKIVIKDFSQSKIYDKTDKPRKNISKKGSAHGTHFSSNKKNSDRQKAKKMNN